MAKGSVRKKGKRWYYRFYIEDESGNRVQKEYPGTESKSETEALLRKAIDNYENSLFVAKAKNITLGDMMDMWIEEEVKPSGRSNGTVTAYKGMVRRVKKHPIGKRKLRTVKSEHLQKFFNLLCKGDENTKPLSTRSVYSYASVFRGAFKFAVFPKQFITFNPMQHITLRTQLDNYELFEEDEMDRSDTISHAQYHQIIDPLKGTKYEPIILPIQIAYYTGVRLGEACALSWQDIDLKKQYLTVRRSLSYNSSRHKMEIGPTKRSKVRTIDFGNTLTEILREARLQQQQAERDCGSYYQRNYFTMINDNGRIHYEIYKLDAYEIPPLEYTGIDLVCRQADGRFIHPQNIIKQCTIIGETLEGLEGFHFHRLRHTYTSNLLSLGATPKEVQELLGHSDVNMTLNVYAHAARDSKRNCVILLDKLETG